MDWARANRGSLVTIVAATIGLGLLVGGFLVNRGNRKDAARTRLGFLTAEIQRATGGEESKRGPCEVSLSELERLAESEGNSFEGRTARYYAGICQRALGEYEEAAASFEQARGATICWATWPPSVLPAFSGRPARAKRLLWHTGACSMGVANCPSIRCCSSLESSRRSRGGRRPRLNSTNASSRSFPPPLFGSWRRPERSGFPGGNELPGGNDLLTRPADAPPRSATRTGHRAGTVPAGSDV